MPHASIVIRTKNEERWLGHCLSMVFQQDFADFEVILVDNRSDDRTLDIARRFPIADLVSISEFRPGLALNLGVRQSSGSHIVCLSGHCVPASPAWLSSLLRNFDDPLIAGAYGRQLPLAFSEAADKRDMLITFGLDRRVQIKDYFFHNANSAVRRDVWDQIPFDETVTNVEDRLWAKAAVEAGYRLAYEPEAAVYHYHGIHHNEDTRRARSVVSVIKQFEKNTGLDGLPDSWKPENINVVALLPVRQELKDIAGHNLLAELVEQLKAARFVKSIAILSECEPAREVASRCDVGFIPRPDWLLESEKGLEDVLQFALAQVERAGGYPEAVLYANYLYPFRPANLFDHLIQDLQHKGLDTVFAASRDYVNYWAGTADGSYVPVGDSLKPREAKQPLYRALYGVGCVSAASVVRAGKLVGQRVGILPVEDPIYSLKYDDEATGRLIRLIHQAPQEHS
jgi:glycosyltransferase involved in cell wall biosynthesis